MMARQVPIAEENHGNGHEDQGDQSQNQNGGGHHQSQQVYSTLEPPRYILEESAYNDGQCFVQTFKH